MWSNLTTKRGDSGSAGMLEEKCVIIGAPKLDTKSDQKTTQQQKINKNWQKSTKSKKSKNEKNQKSSKVTKMRKWKNTKTGKCKKWKSVKKCQKMTPPPKWPKCQINDQNHHFVKSEPPGPAFFRFQGVPRDPVLRPKLTPPFFHCFLIIFCVFLWFMICAFCEFWCFLKCVQLIKCCKSPFLTHPYVM